MTEQIEAKGGLWSDFDGTAVRHYGMANPRNWFKYPLKGLVLYREFVQGASSAGLRPETIVSRRPDILPRRLATAASMRELGLNYLFPDVQLAGSEEEKAARLARRALEPGKPPVAMLEDKPHKFVPHLADAMEAAPGTEMVRVVVGAVDTPKTDDYMDQTLAALETRGFDAGRTRTGAIEAVADRFSLRVVELQPYGFEAGQQFAQQV